MPILDSVETAIAEATGMAAKVTERRSLSGGSINNSEIISLQDGREYFLKSYSNQAQFPGMFEAEFKCLGLLAQTRTIIVPAPVTCSSNFIVLEVFQEADRQHDWYEKIGRQLAQLHLSTQGNRFGFEMDNYLGLSRQPNSWTDDWLSFWRDQRLGWQLELYARKSEAGDRLLELGDRLIVRLQDLIGDIKEPSVLLHGDLWSGNSSANPAGEPVIYDPASYYGHREAEFGMMRMFGGYGPRCEAAYNEIWPFEDGADDRITLYRLYHELNHLNLFGKSYYQRCLDTMESLL
ncbi:MAG: fructosamine kinase family protein [Gammaproteobacteria bacterium]